MDAGGSSGVWQESSRAEARRAADFELNFTQPGLEPSAWKSMKEVGVGVREIRIHVLGEWRVLYVASFTEVIYVLHAFQKKTQRPEKKTSNWLVHDTGRSEAGDEEAND